MVRRDGGGHLPAGRRPRGGPGLDPGPQVPHHRLRGHPDDAELRAGGTAIKWAKQGHRVKLVSVTNGDIGHWRTRGRALAQRRLAEVRAADKILGAETEVLPIHDGELEPTLQNRRAITRLIRQWQADIVIAHRPEWVGLLKPIA